MTGKFLKLKSEYCQSQISVINYQMMQKRKKKNSGVLKSKIPKRLHWPQIKNPKTPQNVYFRNVKFCVICSAAERLMLEHIISALRWAGTLLYDGQYELHCGSCELQQPIREVLADQSLNRFTRAEEAPRAGIIKLTNQSTSCQCRARCQEETSWCPYENVNSDWLIQHKLN